MKKNLLIVFLFISITGSYNASFAQFRNNLRGNGQSSNTPQAEKLESIKIGYITQKLNLTPSEAQRFFPVYNQYVNEIKEVNQEQNARNLSEIEREEKILAIRKKYNDEFRKVVSNDKANTFFSLEKDFRQMLQKELENRRKRDRNN